MKHVLISVLLTLLSISVNGQALIPFLFKSEDDNRYIKENDSFKFYVATGDTTDIVAIDEENFHYRLYNRDHKVMAEGNYIEEGDKYLQDGKWSEFYKSGKVKRTGYYRHSIPVGTWEEYYSGGTVKTISNYGIFDERGEILSCLSGTYQEYFQNGKLKMSGFYSAGFTSTNDTFFVNDPTTGQDIQKVVSHKQLTSAKIGHWEYYNEEGELEKTEDL